MDLSAIASSTGSSIGSSSSKETIAHNHMVMAAAGGGGGGGEGNGSFSAPPPPPPPPSTSRFMTVSASENHGASSLRTTDGGGPSSTTTNANNATTATTVVVRGQVMTDEQMETLRRQISVYATICQQLVEMHKATMAQQNAMSGPRYGQWTTLDPTFHSMGQKFTSRQRWTPSQTQLQILEKLFQQGNGTPSKQRIKEISVELSQYGQISETNVYNWFQNRRARTKRKQQAGGVNNAESEFDTDVDSQEEKKPRMDRDLSHDSLGAGHYATNSQNWGAAEHQPSDATRKGLESSQRLAAVEEFADADPLSNRISWEVTATTHDGKLDHIGTSTSQECQIAMMETGKPVQKYKTFNLPEYVVLIDLIV